MRGIEKVKEAQKKRPRRAACRAADRGSSSAAQGSREQAGRGGALPSLEAFARQYLAHYHTCTPSRLHRFLDEALLHLEAARGRRLAVAAPRGSGKSTWVSLFYPLWAVCQETEKFIVLISDTRAQATAFLECLKAELEYNEALRADFPAACRPPAAGSAYRDEENPARAGRPSCWRVDEIVTGNGIKVVALGAGQSLRGRRHRQHRPTLVIADDLENDESVLSPEVRRKTRTWFHRAVMPCGAPETNFLVIGTLLHEDALLARLVRDEATPGWEKRVFRSLLSLPVNAELWERWRQVRHGERDYPEGSGRAGPTAARAFYADHQNEMDQGAEVLWPQRENLLFLLELECDLGRAAFAAEKQNEPRPAAERIFAESELRYYEEAEFAALQAQQRTFCVGFVDPALGGERGDETAIVVLACDQATGRLYVREAELSRRRPHEVVAAVHEAHARHQTLAFGVEANFYQQMLKDEIDRESDRRRSYLPAMAIVQSVRKELRILRLQPLLARGQVLFRRDQRRLIEQLLDFPQAAHDDGPDALEGAVSVIEQRFGFALHPVTAGAEETSLVSGRIGL